MKYLYLALAFALIGIYSVPASAVTCFQYSWTESWQKTLSEPAEPVEMAAWGFVSWRGLVIMKFDQSNPNVPEVLSEADCIKCDDCELFLPRINLGEDASYLEGSLTSVGLDFSFVTISFVFDVMSYYMYIPGRGFMALM